MATSASRTLQPVFTKKRVDSFAGHMAEAAEMIAASWFEGTASDHNEIDLDGQARLLSMRAVGRPVSGLDLDERSDAVAEPLRIATSYAVSRALRPLRAPAWMPPRSRIHRSHRPRNRSAAV